LERGAGGAGRIARGKGRTGKTLPHVLATYFSISAATGAFAVGGGVDHHFVWYAHSNADCNTYAHANTNSIANTYTYTKASSDAATSLVAKERLVINVKWLEAREKISRVSQLRGKRM
jgi:hypothetical protein